MYKNRLLQFIASFYSIFVTSGSCLQSLYLLWIRMTWGHQFFIVGHGKLHNITPVIELFTSLGIPFPELSAYLVGYIEMIGGVLLFMGFCSRIAGFFLSIVMIVALSLPQITLATSLHFLFDPSMLINEATYRFMITALLIFIFGPGRLSIDAWLKRWSEQQPKY